MSSISTISSEKDLINTGYNRSGKTKWRTLIHNGVCFPPEYTVKGLTIKINGKQLLLNREQEELIYAWAKKKDTHYIEDPVFQKNFLSDFKKLLSPDIAKDIQEISHIDFTEFFNHGRQPLQASECCRVST